MSKKINKKSPPTQVSETLRKQTSLDMTGLWEIADANVISSNDNLKHPPEGWKLNVVDNLETVEEKQIIALVNSI